MEGASVTWLVRVLNDGSYMKMTLFTIDDLRRPYREAPVIWTAPILRFGVPLDEIAEDKGTFIYVSLFMNLIVNFPYISCRRCLLDTVTVSHECDIFEFLVST